MFDHKWLDRVSRVHWTVPLFVFVPVIVAFLAIGFADGIGLMGIVWLAAGYAFWTLFEYWLHRIVFHFEPDKGIGARLHWIMHGVHHDHPFLAGYLVYDMLHDHVHHRRPTTWLGKRMRELHMRHHFQDHDRGYGVSSPYWDHVFGTAPKKRP
jgi:dihydroceramide fatty acyl 2-hydroxylase